MKGRNYGMRYHRIYEMPVPYENSPKNSNPYFLTNASLLNLPFYLGNLQNGEANSKITCFFPFFSTKI